MIKKLSLFLVLFSVVFSLSCASNGKKTSNSNAKTAANADVKKGVAPVADNEIAVMETDFGTIKIELYSNIAPKMVARFKELAKEGYYNGIAWHRINNSVIQAGNADTKPGAAPSIGKEGDSGKPNVDAEFSDIPYDTGILGAARLGNDVNSANSQFFIMLKREKAFDNNYTVFGKVIEGMNTVITISGVPREGEKPNPPVRIKSVTIQPK
ncbi:MAG TPA: peptidylprolyl isomerase [Pyrinomonadaceae bacterium]|nr:peptidylprolyl isomerase [Pyrinomonadaceae bacterium]